MLVSTGVVIMGYSGNSFSLHPPNPLPSALAFSSLLLHSRYAGGAWLTSVSTGVVIMSYFGTCFPLHFFIAILRPSLVVCFCEPFLFLCTLPVFFSVSIFPISSGSCLEMALKVFLPLLCPRFSPLAFVYKISVRTCTGGLWPALVVFGSAAIVSMPFVQLSYSKLLEDIAGLLGVDTPPCEVTVVPEGRFLAYVDLHVPRDGPILEVVRCWGVRSPNLGVAKEDATRVVVRRMKEELDLQIKDANYDDFVIYKNLYDHVTIQYADLSNQFNNLEREHNLLKECYVSGLAEKTDLITEQVKMRHTIDEYRATVDRFRGDRVVALSHPSESTSSA